MTINPEDIEQLAMAPRKVETDGHMTEERPIEDVIRGLEYAKAVNKKAVKRIGLFTLRLGGSVHRNSQS
jgi:hypothetical protein